MEEDSNLENLIKIGVTITESDVYETAELPEDDQQLVLDYLTESPRSEFIESSRIDANEAFKAFADKSLESENVDFSDSIATPKVGYPMTKKSDLIKKETLEEKYARLLKAVDNMAQEINILKDKTSECETSDPIKSLSTLSMVSRLEHLQKEISSAGSKDDVVVLDSEPRKIYQRKLLADLDSFISSSSLSPVPPSSSSSSAPVSIVKYQMYCAPGQSLHSDNALIEDLVQRLERCEDAIGLSSDKSGFLTGEHPCNTLLGALSLVAAKFALLDLSQLSHFESSLLAIQQKQIQASSKSEASDIADKVDKVSHTYELVKRCNPMMEKLPGVSDRLKSMIEVHQSATQFSRTLAYLDASQRQLIEHLQNHTEHLKQIQALMGPQMALFANNCKTIDELIV